MKYIVVIADIVDSKKIADRSGAQNQLKTALESINSISTDLVSPYTITLGDEFQAVYGSPKKLLQDLLQIAIGLFPLRIRFSIGIGDISTEINPRQALGMDGPAFYLARDGMELLKKTRHTAIQFHGSNIPCLAIINTSLQLVMSLVNEWKPNTLHMLHGHLKGIPVQEIASNLHLSERGVYKAIALHKVRSFADFFNSLEETLQTLDLL